jgi:hypothetical protein
MADKAILLAGKTLDVVMPMIRSGRLPARQTDICHLPPERCASRMSDLLSINLGQLASLVEVSEDHPLRVAVTGASLRHRVPGFEFSTFPEEFPKGTLLEIATGILVPSFECYFLLKARDLSFEKLVLLGIELTGRFAHARMGDASTACEFLVDPVTTSRELSNYVKECAGTTGSRPARAAVPWVLDNAYSPREAVIALEQCLPPKRGGRGYPRPILNAEISVPPSLRHLVARDTFTPDVYWPELLDVEYDGGYHNEETQVERDKARVADIQAMGIAVISATKLTLSTCERAELLGRQIGSCLAKGIGRPMRRRNARLGSLERVSERAALHARLMDAAGSSLSRGSAQRGAPWGFVGDDGQAWSR